jgi:hypothetical protein
MEKSCSFVGVGGISCGTSRGLREISCLFDCKEDMSGQLSNCHLPKSNLRESEFIAIRAGMFNRTEDQFKMMSICPSHRHNLGRFWRPLRPCQYIHYIYTLPLIYTTPLPFRTPRIFYTSCSFIQTLSFSIPSLCICRHCLHIAISKLYFTNCPILLYPRTTEIEYLLCYSSSSRTQKRTS